MMSKYNFNVRGNLWKQFKDKSEIVARILYKRLWKPGKKQQLKTCEHGKVYYQDVSLLCRKQLRIIQDLADAVVMLEKHVIDVEAKFTKTENAVENLTTVSEKAIAEKNKQLKFLIEKVKRLEVKRHAN